MAKKTAAKRKTPAKAKPASKKTAQKSDEITETRPRRLKTARRLPNAWQLGRLTAELLWRQRKLFIGLTIVYGLLNLVLVQGLANSADINNLKSQVSQLSHGHLGSLGSGLGIFAVLVSSAGNGSSQTAGSYQLFLALITSLAIIWALRQVMAGHQIRIRDAFYRGMFPLIPFVLVLIVVGLQLIPLLIGATLYSTVISGGIAASGIEKLFWLLLFLALAALTLYWLSSSLFGLYIVTLPDMTPIKALRSARQLVKGRRLAVLRKIISLPIILLVIAALIMLPIIVWLTGLTQWVFFLLTMLALSAIHGYMYTLYRELLDD